MDRDGDGSDGHLLEGVVARAHQYILHPIARCLLPVICAALD